MTKYLSESKKDYYKARMISRRDRDKRGQFRRRRDGDGSRYPMILYKLRKGVMMCYAINIRTWEMYVGYSGGGSVVAAREIAHAAYDRRIARVDRYLRGCECHLDYNGRGLRNCAEVAALNNALSFGENIADLYFISMDTENRLTPPCRNCRQWIFRYAAGAYGL